MDWLDKAFNYGVPTALLMLGCFGVWQVCRWLKTKVAEPMVAAHLLLMQTLTDHMPKQTEELKAQTNILRRIEEAGCGQVVAQSRSRGQGAVINPELSRP